MRKIIFLLLIFIVPELLNAQHNILIENDNANGQGNFENVEPGDTVYIQSGDRPQLILQNFHGTESQPIVFWPSDRNLPVRIRSQGSYGISIRNCSFIQVSGWRQHEGACGIQILELNHESSVGVSVASKSTDVELDHIEIANVGFAGIIAKTEPECGDPETHRGGFVQRNTSIHHCYIHDTGGEGIYVGATNFHGQELADCEKVLPIVLEGVKIYKNRIERTGWDGIQVSSAISDCQIYDNEVIDCSVLQEENQMSGILIGGGTLADCYNNLIVDCYGTGILVFGDGGTRVFNNIILRAAKRYAPSDPQEREHGIYIDDKTGHNKTFYGIYSNTIIQPKSDCIRISETVNFEVQLYNNLLIDPGAWTVYENDNTDRTGNDSYVFVIGDINNIRKAGNRTTRSLTFPRFVNVDEDDFHLDVSSPYIDAGWDLSDKQGVSFDFEYKKRPFGKAFDIGAFEYGNTSWIRNDNVNEKVIKVVYQPSGDNRGLLKISASSTGNYFWQIISIDGRIIRQENFVDGGIEERIVPLDNMTPGIYVLSFQSDTWQQSEKLLVY